MASFARPAAGHPSASATARRPTGPSLAFAALLLAAPNFVALVLVAATMAPEVQAATKPRPEIVVSGGSASASQGRLRGSLVLANRGSAASGHFTVRLIVGKHGRQRVAERLHLGSLRPSRRQKVAIAAPLPPHLPVGKLGVHACVVPAGKAAAHSLAGGCRQIGTVQVGTGPAPAGPPAPGPPPGSGAPVSTVPRDPVPFKPGVPFTLDSPESDYWVDVPNAYDATNQTPTTLFVWLHGCGGESSGDIWTVSPTAWDWISIAVGGREGECWEPNTDGGKVLAAIADVKTHFNIEPHRVILGGYSSGGDLAYRIAFYNSAAFAGVLAENTSPFRDTGSTAAASLAAATVKFHVVHLAHLQDTTYPIVGVREETDAMLAAGFPLTRIEVDGGHYDEPGAKENGHKVPGTDADLVKYLLPHIDDGWRSP